MENSLIYVETHDSLTELGRRKPELWLLAKMRDKHGRPPLPSDELERAAVDIYSTQIMFARRKTLLQICGRHDQGQIDRFVTAVSGLPRSAHGHQQTSNPLIIIDDIKTFPPKYRRIP